jgi:hypothetical protein
MIPRNNFNRAKPFYPIVMHYIIQLIGFKELAIRGLPNISQQLSINLPTSEIPQSHPLEEQIENLEKSLTKISGPLQLHTVQSDTHIEIDIKKIATELSEHVQYLGNFMMASAASVLILAHEHCVGKPFRNNDPLWEFLRHCRNAAGHGCKFNFLYDEPKRPAIWGKLEITQNHQGQPLFIDGTNNGFMSPGDVLGLLWDLEQSYPDIC